MSSWFYKFPKDTIEVRIAEMIIYGGEAKPINMPDSVPIPIIICGKRAEIAEVVKNIVEPEFEGIYLSFFLPFYVNTKKMRISCSMVYCADGENQNSHPCNSYHRARHRRPSFHRGRENCTRWKYSSR